MQNKIEELLHQPMVVINLGLESFAENMKEQGADVVHLDWRPPADGDEQMMELLDKLL